MIYKAAVVDFVLMDENIVQDFGPWSKAASRFFHYGHTIPPYMPWLWLGSN